MSVDIASLGIELDSRQVVEGTNALDKLGEASKTVEQKMGAMNGQMNDTAKIMKAQADAANAASEASEKFLDKLRREIDLYGLNRAETERYNAAMAGLSGTTQQAAAALGMKIDAMQREEKAARDAAAAEDQMTKAADRFMKSLQDQVATVGMSTSQLQAYRAAQLGVSDAAAPLIKSLADTGAGAKGAGAHMDGFSMSSVGARRELLVLAHEMSQGNFQKFGGSMMVLGEQTGAASLLFSAMGLSVLAVVGTLGLLAAGMIKGASDQKHMNDALLMTGNYAGLTSDSLNAMAHAAVEAGGSLGEAKKVATELAGSGKFTGDQIAYITEATVEWEHATGQSTKSIIASFESLAVQSQGSNMRATEAISRATLKLDDTYHFLTESVYEQIRALEKEGDAKGASALATETFAKAVKERAEESVKNLGKIAKVWNEIKEAAGAAADAVGDYGKRATPATAVKTASFKLDQYDSGLTAIGMKPDQLTGDWATGRAKLVADLAAAQGELNKANAAGVAQGKAQFAQSEATHAASRIAQDDAKLQKKGVTELQVALGAYADDVAKVKAVNPGSALVTDEAVAAHVAAITKAHTASVKGADDRAALEQGALVREQANLDGEKSIYDSRVKMLDTYHSKMGMADGDFYSGRAAARADYIAAEAISYAKELAIVQSYKPKNAEEVAASRNKYDELVKQHTKFVADMRNGGGDDSAAAAAATAKQFDDYAKAVNTAGDAELKSLDAAIGKQREHNAEIGKSKEEIELARVAREGAATQSMQAEANAIQGVLDEQDASKALAVEYRDIYAARLAYLDREIAKRQTLSGLYAAGADLEAGSAAASSLDKFLDPTKAHAFGDALRGGFDGASSAIDKMVGKLEKYGSKEAEIDKQRGNAASLYLNGKKTESEYTDITDELNRRSSANRIGEYATMTDAAQSYFKQGSAGYEAIGAASKVLHAAELAMNLASIGPKMAAGAASFFAESGWGGFAGVAAMVAVVAGFGVAVSGGGGGADTTAKDRQAANGTGTVLGDSTAKSDSINRAIGLTAKNTSTLIDYTASMVAALNSIETNIGSFTSQLLQSTTVGTALPGVQKGAAASLFNSGGLLGKFEGAIGNAIFGGNVTSLDTGLTATKTALGTAVSTGIQASQYTDTKKDGGWFHSDSYSTQLNSLGTAANDQFKLIIKSMADSVTEAAKLIGVGGDAFSQHLNAFVIDIGKISTKDMTGDQIQTAIQAAFSKVGDDMANWAVAGLGQFQKVGEGSLETLVRVATDYAKLDASLVSVGLTFGQTGVASIAARESLIALAGGIDNFQSAVADYSKNFLTQAEQLAPVAKYVNDQLGTMGLSWIKTRADFKAEIDSLSGNLSDPGVQQTYAALMNLESAFAAVTPAIEDTTKSMQEISDERKNLQDQLDTLTMTSAQLLAKQRNALDASNQSLFDQVQAATAAKAAQDALKTSLTDTISSMKSFKDSTQQLHDGLLTGSNSPLTPEQQYAESKRQYEATKTAAMGGDTTAQGQYAAMLNSFLAASKVVNASDSQYTADFAETLADSNAMAKWAGTQVDTAQASLDALNAQVAGITDVNTSVQGVTAAVNQLTTTLGGTPAVTMPTPVLSAVTVNNDNPALVAQVAEMTAELRQLRADMATQTGDQIKGNADATKAAAETVVSGTGSLASTITRAAGYAKLEYA